MPLTVVFALLQYTSIYLPDLLHCEGSRQRRTVTFQHNIHKMVPPSITLSSRPSLDVRCLQRSLDRKPV
ncbi:hypothetical protein NQ317_007268 [Molorchus minor]|uniref:Secreted protein n=1 Tax=Molorchus minor TaxID=1323400 RepID=A0ABQ9JHR3_9CUCU|nr:hypothetical protein NQ317_007268 [Molorchus minor]